MELLARELGLVDVDLAHVERLAAEGEAPASDWLQRIIDAAQVTDLGPDEEPTHAVPVRTIFGAKGLQSPIVFLANSMTASFVGRGNVADGVRRCYVGVTRAQRYLLVSAPLWLHYSTLEHKVGSTTGGLADIVAHPATQMASSFSRSPPRKLPKRD